MMRTFDHSLDRETLRTEIQTAIKAGRDLDPSMDGHLADSVLDSYLASQPRGPQMVEVRDDRLSADGIILRGVSLLLSVGVIIALIASQVWWMYWLIIPIMGMLMAIFGRGNRRRWEQQVHGVRQQQRDERRHYKESQLRYKIEKLEAKRAFVNGFTKGFKGSEQHH